MHVRLMVTEQQQAGIPRVADVSCTRCALGTLAAWRLVHAHAHAPSVTHLLTNQQEGVVHCGGAVGACVDASGIPLEVAIQRR